MAVTAGFTLPAQAGVNARLAGYLGSAVLASTVSFAVGTLTLIAYVSIWTGFGPGWAAARSAPWWVWFGGCLGAFFVAAVTFLAPRLGATAMVALVVAGQMSASLALDHFGVLGYQANPVSLSRILGVLFILIGVYLVQNR
ncbi:MAG: DMT family transporter [Deltaproteobacteria bacterium]|nr:DMT family transporter [Deltaproteobacteria bacterium]